MHTLTKKQILFSIVAVAVVLGLIAFANRGPSLSVTILNPKFRLLTARLSHGTTHQLYWTSTAMGQMTDLLRRAGFNVGIDPLVAPTTNRTYALVVRFTGDFAPNELKGIQAEVVDQCGKATRLPRGPGYNSGSTPHEYGNIWVLDSSLTNAITIRLRPGIGQPPLAEVRVEAR